MAVAGWKSRFDDRQRQSTTVDGSGGPTWNGLRVGVGTRLTVVTVLTGIVAPRRVKRYRGAVIQSGNSRGERRGARIGVGVLFADETGCRMLIFAV
jgi:hypothetical protein